MIVTGSFSLGHGSAWLEYLRLCARFSTFARLSIASRARSIKVDSCLKDSVEILRIAVSLVTGPVWPSVFGLAADTSEGWYNSATKL